MVGRKRRPDHIAHLTKQRLAEGGVLVRLLILAVLPSVRRRDQRPAEPACWPADLLLLPGKDDALPHYAQHLHAEGLVAGHQIQAALVGKAGGDHRLLIEGGNDGAIHGLQLAFRLDDAMLERLEHAAQTVAGQLVRVTHPRPQRGVGGRQLDEETIDRCHG